LVVRVVLPPVVEMSVMPAMAASRRSSVVLKIVPHDPCFSPEAGFSRSKIEV